ncbi:RNA-binding protein, putative [Leishmania tarentolae]|uniref:RNA-binding protein, putative n=1 Tax=Leishmania tarentolae TaxID=5689 RepID=A0A640KLG6_LEITA|nr:RNA-binding protein, putative [Leishmania tarentolae]
MSACTVYVTGMPTSVTEDDIFDFFTRIGNVAEVHMPSAGSQTTSGATAVVEVVFDKPEDAISAVSISGSDFQEDTPIYISAVAPTAAAAEKPTDQTTTAADAGSDFNGNGGAAAASAEPGAGLPMRRSADAERTSKNKVVVSSIYPHTTRAQLREIFSPCGTICDFHLIPTRHMAFVGYTTGEAYEKALKLDGAMVNGNPVVVRSCPSREDGAAPASRRDVSRRVTEGTTASSPNRRQLDVRVVVHGVPSDVTKEALRAFFSPDCGPLTDVFLKPEIGVAFVAFTSAENAKRAIRKSGEMFMGTRVKIEQRLPLICRRCDKEGHVAAQCKEHVRGSRRRSNERRRRRRSSSSSLDRDRRRRRRSHSLDRDRRRSDSLDRDRHRSDSLDRARRRSDSLDRDRHRRRYSRSRSPPRRRRHSRSPSRSRSPPRSRSPARRR